MVEVDLEPVEAAVAALRAKYPDFVGTNFEPTIGAFSIPTSAAPHDAWTHIMIVPNNMTTKEGYQRNIEAFFGSIRE
jgi:hypothetical protein